MPTVAAIASSETMESAISEAAVGLFPLKKFDSRTEDVFEVEANESSERSENCVCCCDDDDDDDVENGDDAEEEANNPCDSEEAIAAAASAAATAAVIEYDRFMASLIDDEDVKVGKENTQKNQRSNFFFLFLLRSFFGLLSRPLSFVCLRHQLFLLPLLHSRVKRAAKTRSLQGENFFSASICILLLSSRRRRNARGSKKAFSAKERKMHFSLQSLSLSFRRKERGGRTRTRTRARRGKQDPLRPNG